MKPIILIFGPSGVGKSTTTDWIVEDLNFLHFNFDNWDNKGIDGSEIKSQTEEFFTTLEPSALRAVIDRYIHEKSGAVVSFISNIIPSVAHIKAGESLGIKTIILYGSQEDCLAAFKAREMENGRNLTVEHWKTHNMHIYNGELTPEHTPYLLYTFDKRVRRSREDIVNNIRERIAS